MQAETYVRFRVNGQAYEFDELPKFKTADKQSRNVVIAKLKVRFDLKQRLAENFEAALQLADGWGRRAN